MMKTDLSQRGLLRLTAGASALSANGLKGFASPTATGVVTVGGLA